MGLNLSMKSGDDLRIGSDLDTRGKPTDKASRINSHSQQYNRCRAASRGRIWVAAGGQGGGTTRERWREPDEPGQRRPPAGNGRAHRKTPRGGGPPERPAIPPAVRGGQVHRRREREP
jgi:hypothetical protein